MTHACRSCGAPLSTPFADLGVTPLANSYLSAADLERGETFYPLVAYVCERCLLVQLPAHETPDAIFSHYLYLSSFSDTWLAHARRYVDEMVGRFGLTANHLVVELASNDGYLLQYFVERGIPVLGIEPARNVAEIARQRGVDTLAEFFGTALARSLVAEGRRADLLAANNVLAHVPDLNDFVGGIAVLLAEEGVATIEFPHLLELMENSQFDTIYHEHFSYFSLYAVEQVFRRQGLRVFDVERLTTHGGSLRLYVCRPSARHETTARVQALLDAERAAGLLDLETYKQFDARAQRVKRDLLRFLIDAKEAGKRVIGYGAPAKGNTLLNYCGVRTDLLSATVDRSPHKQGCWLPGTRIPIHAPEYIQECRPDYVLILPWNLREEISESFSMIREWGGRFVVAVPGLEVF
jgi:SAM-dependent methyltransferase